MYLAADVGGTKVLLSAFTLPKAPNGQPIIHAQAHYASADFSSLEACIQTFQSQFQLFSFSAACLGLPAPITDFPLTLTNLDWQIVPERLKSQCHIAQLYLLNDFTAAAWGVEQICQQWPSPDLVSLQQPSSFLSESVPPTAPRLVVGAGTGLGVAPVAICDGRGQPLASEGGHMDFAPNQVWQQKLLSFLWKSWSHVSYERILSGSGLGKLYQFWQAEAGDKGAPLKPEALASQAQKGHVLAQQTLESFVSIYGSYLGSVGLFWPATGGIFIAGGIAAKILPWMQSAHFLEALHAKGRMTPLTRQWPIWVVTDPALGLKGAIYYLQLQASSSGQEKVHERLGRI